jgi:hypothetical protein
MTKRLILIGLLGLVACATRTRTVVVERHEEGHGREGWVKLGEREVNGRVDYDTIEVGGHEGRFRKVMFVVENSAVEMFDVSINFGDGSSFSPATRLIFPADTRSRVIDLPGGERVIRNVQFKYGNLPGGGRARVELWAR